VVVPTAGEDIGSRTKGLHLMGVSPVVESDIDMVDSIPGEPF